MKIFHIIVLFFLSCELFADNLNSPVDESDRLQKNNAAVQVTDSRYDDCVLANIAQAKNDASVQGVREFCNNKIQTDSQQEIAYGVVTRRFIAERQAQWNRHVVTAHRQNYILPYTHTNKLNRDAYAFSGDIADGAKHSEAKFQLSIKTRLNTGDMLTKNDAIYFGFTVQSWWQVFAGDISAPFRETNYQPQLFYLTSLDWHPLGGNTGLVFGIEHQSNGRAQEISRSWNRIFTSLIFEKENFALTLRPWYRFKEDKKESPLSSDGDDNPDIEAYMGHFELRSVYRRSQNEFSLMWRNNLRSDNKGAAEIGWSFPLRAHLKGYVQYFNGYGESLIDYNISTSRLGVGILLTDLL